MDYRVQRKKWENLYGFADAKEEIIKTLLLDIEYLNTNLAGGIIKNTAKLVRKLDTNQISQIKIVAEKKEMTALFTNIYNRIREDNQSLAEELKTKTLTGNYDETFANSIRYELKPEEAGEFITIGQNQMEIYLNDDAVGTNQSLMTRTLAHELKHLEYAFLHPYTKLKWMVLRDKDPNNPGYIMRDEYRSNDYCSAGAGHEKYNPENKEVCNIENDY